MTKRASTPPNGTQPTDPRRVYVAGKISSSQDGVVVLPWGSTPCHTAGHGNCPKILIEYD